MAGGGSDPDGFFGISGSLGLWWDANGVSDTGTASTLNSMRDDRDPWPWVEVYDLAAEFHDLSALSLLKIGRQVSLHGLPVTFDGVSMEISALKPWLGFFAMGGRTVHFFETDSGIFEDWIASIGAVVRPMRGLRLELDYRFQREQILAPDKVSRNELMDHTYGLSLWYRHGERLYLNAYFRGLNDSVSHAGTALHFDWTDKGVGLDLGFDAQLITLRQANEGTDPYFALLGERLPYVRWRMDLWKVFTTKAGEYGIHAGWNGNQLVEGDTGPFNRNMGRFYLTFTANDIGVKGPFLNVSAEGYYSDWTFAGDWFWTAGGSVGYASGKVGAEVGTYFQQYKYVYYRDVREISDVRTVFGQVAYRPLKWLKLKVRYEFQRYDRDEHALIVTVSQVF